MKMRYIVIGTNSALISCTSLKTKEVQKKEVFEMNPVVTASSEPLGTDTIITHKIDTVTNLLGYDNTFNVTPGVLSFCIEDLSSHQAHRYCA